MKYFITLFTGQEYEVSEMDYHNIEHRIGSGRTNGFYNMRGDINPSLKFAFKYFMSIEKRGREKPKNIPVRNLDPKKFEAPKVGKPEKISKKCPHDWNNPDDFEYVKKTVNGKVQHRKECKECKGLSPLIKPREAELAMEAINKTIDDIKVLT